MMILNMIACMILFMAFLLIMMGIVVRKLREKAVKRSKREIYKKMDMIMDDMEDNHS